MSPFLLSDQLAVLDPASSRPADLPGRFGRVIADTQRLLTASATPAVVAGGWAVWHHGYAGRVTRDLDLVVPTDKVEELLQVAPRFGFTPLSVKPGGWPKLLHRETEIDLDLLPQGQRPGTTARPAPTTIPHPSLIGASTDELRYIELAGLVELKLAAGRLKDLADVVELIRHHPERLTDLRRHLRQTHQAYVMAFDDLIAEAAESD